MRSERAQQRGVGSVALVSMVVSVLAGACASTVTLSSKSTSPVAASTTIPAGVATTTGTITEPVTVADTTSVPVASTIAGVDPPVGGVVLSDGVDISDAHLLAPGHGWIVLRTAVFATSDGGRSWARGFHAGKDTWIAGSGQFARTALLVISDGTVNASSDGGFHWERRGSLAQFNTGTGETHVSFVDDRHGWAAVHEGSGTSDAARLYETVDAGHTWVNVADGFSGGIVFTTANDGWAVRLFQPVLEATHDRGRTWSPQPLPTFADEPGAQAMLSEAPQFAGAAGVQLVAHSGAWTAPLLLLTGDRGRSWRTVTVPLPSPPSTRYGSSGSQWLPMLAVVDAQHLRVGDATRIDVSDDAGHSWVAHNLPLPVSGLVFVDADHGWVVSNTAGCHSFKTDCWNASTLLATSDGGTTWTGVALPTSVTN